MNVWTHTVVAATTLVAVTAVGLASAGTILRDAPEQQAMTLAKGDRLAALLPYAEATETVEHRGDGVSELVRVPAN